MMRKGNMAADEGISRDLSAENNDMQMYSPDIDYKAIGQKLREEREKIGWTQESVAEVLDITPAFVGHIERAERSMSLNTLIRFCNFYHITIDYLLSDTLPPQHDNIATQITSLLKPKTAVQQLAILDIINAITRHI